MEEEGKNDYRSVKISGKRSEGRKRVSMKLERKWSREKYILTGEYFEDVCYCCKMEYPRGKKYRDCGNICGKDGSEMD